MAIDEMNISVKDNPSIGILKCMLLNQSSTCATTEEYSRLISKHEATKREFESLLTKEQDELYKQVTNNASDEEYQTGNENFIMGFKTAVLLLMECFQ